jgi:hypothetical protein
MSIAPLLVAAFGVLSCSLAISFDDYETSERHEAAAPPLYAVRGTVDGLDGAKVVLRVAHATLEIGDGPFSFPATLPAGAAWTVSVAADPPSHACTVEHGEGRIDAGDGSGVAVHCPSTVATLQGLFVSAAPLLPTFNPTTFAYRTRGVPLLFGARTTTIRANATDPKARVSLSGVPLAYGVESGVLHLAQGPNVIDLTVVAADRRTEAHYTVVVSASDYLKASNTRRGAGFGHAVALSGTTLAVAAPGEASAAMGVNGDQTSTAAPRAGAVYVFTRSGSTWSQQAFIKASNTRAEARFGAAVALDGDTLAVGSPDESSTATGIDGDQSATPNAVRGAVYVFTRTSSAWSQQAYVKPSTTSIPAGSFGSAVALSGNVLAVGDPTESSCATGIDGDETTHDAAGLPSCARAGSVWAYTRSGTTWSRHAYIKASNTHADSRFGSAVALDGATLAVGAPGEASGTGIVVDGDQTSRSSPGAGAVYAFTRSGASWTQQGYLKPLLSETGAVMSFGAGVALSGAALAVTSPNDGSVADPGGRHPGALYAFGRWANAWEFGAYLSLPFDAFSTSVPYEDRASGTAVAFSGEFLAVGRPATSGNASGLGGTNTRVLSAAGGAYFLARCNDCPAIDNWRARQVTVNASHPKRGTWFGTAVAVSPQFLVVGAEGESSNAVGVAGDETNTSAPGAGAVYVF